MNIAIVTGASSGMGREFVLQLPGYVEVDEIWAIARRREALEALKSEVSIPVRPIVLDLCDASSFDAVANLLKTEKPNIKLLVNAAGFGKFGAFHKVSPEDDCRMIDLNCKALVMMTRLCIPCMEKGIRVMAMNPGWVKTEFFNHAFQTNDGNEVQYFDRLYEAKDCVATGLRDLYKSRKDYSVHGLPVQLQVLLVKIVPHRFVMNIWLSQQKKPKNNQGLTTK